MIEQLYIIPILLFSVIIHEIAHGLMALRLGDPTARDRGRLTLNPIPHIDLFGSILIPLFSLMAAGSVFIAWAKPVPVNPANFSNYKRDDVLVSAVGPFSNILLAFVCSVAVIGLGVGGNVVARDGLPIIVEGIAFLMKMFYGGIYLNIVLAVFNMIPVPPLDGSHILATLLPDGVARRYRSVGFLGIFIIIFMMRVPMVSSAFTSIIHGIFAPFHSMISFFV